MFGVKTGSVSVAKDSKTIFATALGASSYLDKLSGSQLIAVWQRKTSTDCVASSHRRRIAYHVLLGRLGRSLSHLGCILGGQSRSLQIPGLGCSLLLLDCGQGGLLSCCLRSHRLKGTEGISFKQSKCKR